MTLAITPGEPAGIGPDVVLATLASTDANALVIASIEMLEDRARMLGMDLAFNDYAASGKLIAGKVNVLHVATSVTTTPGQLDPRNARYVLATLEQAVSLCESGTCAGMVTGPVNKAAINDSGIAFSGHTEWLAERTGVDQVVMLLATEGMKVALATTHLPLRAVADAVTSELLERVIAVLANDLKSKFGVPSPRILVLGLNPHAGESGHLGREEIETIEPTLERLRSQGYNLTGPVPADTAFTPHLLDRHDVVLAMYHDQGLPVLKFKGFGAAANITLGLPIIRTSVDHGTALDLAGKGTADAASLNTAMSYARLMAAAHDIHQPQD